MNLFLDDIRPAPAGWNWVYDVAGAAEWVKANGVPERLSLDHDLGEDQPTAMVFLKWLIENHLDGVFDLSTITYLCIHSANPVGARNLADEWNSFAHFHNLPLRALIQPATTFTR